MVLTVQGVVQSHEVLEEFRLDLHEDLPANQRLTWEQVFPHGQPKVWLLPSQLKDLQDAGLIKLTARQGIEFHAATLATGPKKHKCVKSWIFVSSYGRHGQKGSDGNRSPGMLIDWTAAVAPDVQYVRVIVIREEQLQVTF